MKYRLLGLENRIHSLLKACLQRANQADLHTCEFKEEIDDQLLDLYLSRVKLTPRLSQFLEKMGHHKLFNDLKEIGDHMERLQNGHWEEKQLREWEKKVENFQVNFFLARDKKKFKARWQSKYSHIVHKAKILSLYMSWEQIVLNESQLFTELLPKIGPIQAALKATKCVYIDKRLYFNHYLHDKKVISSAIQICGQLFRRNPDKMNTDLFFQIEKVKARIFAQENQMFSRIVPVSYVIASVLNHIPHYRIADLFSESHEQMTQSWHNVPVLSARLRPDILFSSKLIMASGLLGSDFMYSRWLGISQKLLQTVSQQITPSISSWITWLQHAGYDDKTAILTFPLIETVTECTCFIALSSFSMGFTVPVLCQSVISYAVGLTVVTLTGHAIDRWYDKDHRENISSHYSFIRTLAHMAAFPLACHYITPFLLPPFGDRALKSIF